LFWPQGGLELQSPATQEDRGDRGGDAQSVQLYFDDAQAQNLASESRKLDFGEGLEENVQATVAALASGPQQEGNVAVLPREARVEQVSPKRPDRDHTRRSRPTPRWGAAGT
jgi:hypothetical protein